jgi:hypothetical protein
MQVLGVHARKSTDLACNCTNKYQEPKYQEPKKLQNLKSQKSQNLKIAKSKNPKILPPSLFFIRHCLICVRAMGEDAVNFGLLNQRCYLKKNRIKKRWQAITVQ